MRDVMTLSEAIDAIETSDSPDELRSRFQRIVENYGFANFAFLDIGTPGDEERFVIPTQDLAWSEDYRANGFVEVDPVVSHARRTNRPFAWSDVALPTRLGKRKPAALKLMDAAQDHGLKNGLVVTFHIVDGIGRVRSMLCVFFWKDMQSRFFSLIKGHRQELHLLMIYFSQKAMDLHRAAARRAEPKQHGEAAVVLTDRERSVLSWAARGKTIADTAAILGVSDETAETHIRNAMRKLGGLNKTHAAVKAIKLGLIDA